MPILKMIGILMIVFVAGVSGYLYVAASKLEREIEAESQNRKEK
jgi:hypothetical protein